jgi:hypothetical protein
MLSPASSFHLPQSLYVSHTLQVQRSHSSKYMYITAQHNLKHRHYSFVLSLIQSSEYVYVHCKINVTTKYFSLLVFFLTVPR